MTGEVQWLGCVAKDGYRYTRGLSFDRRPALKGRPRFRLKDTRPIYEVVATMDLSPSLFNAWQTFWAGACQRGAKPFLMRLQTTTAVLYNSGTEVYEVSAKQPWAANLKPDGNWIVNLVLDVPWTFGFVGTICDVIYGGPITELAPDDIYGGPITNLATDVIEPCEGVLG